MKLNPTTSKDFYKAGHPDQYPEGTTFVYSNFTPRSDSYGKVSELFDQKIVWFGLQGFVKWFLIDTWNNEFFNKPKEQAIGAYKRRMDTSLGEGSVAVERLAALHDLGYLPVLIKALPEGSRVNLKVPFFTIQNTHPDFFWLTNYLETALSNEIWKPTTVATIAFEFRRVLDKFVELTGSSTDFADWQNHDFSMRGMSGLHDASSSCAGHLLSNNGTDTITAIDYLENYYNANAEAELVGGSVPATEHSVMCAGGAEDEQETIRRLIQDIYPSGVVSVVSDTWDFWNIITATSKNLKQIILGRVPNSLGQAKVVFRPDSGDPVKILTGYTYFTPSDLQQTGYDEANGFELAKVGNKYYCFTKQSDEQGDLVGAEWFELGQEIPEHEVKGAVECLWDVFGGTTTDKGFKTLNERVGLIYGDSITLERQFEILQRLMKKGFSAGNVVFGVGSYTYQYVTRDTFGMAMKATFACVNRQDKELFKDPLTDSGGVKKSAKGLLRVEKQGNDFVLYDKQTREQEQQGALEPVFHNGKLVRDMTLSQIRENLKSSLTN